jgi:hypothetical protein
MDDILTRKPPGAPFKMLIRRAVQALELTGATP